MSTRRSPERSEEGLFRPSMRITLLGPQRRPTVHHVLQDVGPDVPIATVTAGWREREDDDHEVHHLLGGRTVNLGLHRRWLDVQEGDRELAVAELEHRAFLDELQRLHLLQLESAVQAAYAAEQASADRPRARAAARADAQAVLRLVDDRHLARVQAAHADFEAAWRPAERPVVAAHRMEVREALQQSGALVVAGGHVGVLGWLLRLFDVAPYLPDTVVAWSAGAMALTERVVLFHDLAAQGPSPAEIYDDGLAVVRDVVLLPHARRRLRVDDPTRMAVLAARFEPATCVVLDDGARLDLGHDGELPGGTRVVDSRGHIRALETAA